MPAARWYVALALVVIAFIVYGSLVPFDFRSVSLGEAWRSFIDALLTPPAGAPSRTDVIANVLLAVPLGFFLAGAFLAGRDRWGRRVVAVVLILPATLAIAATAELLQMFAANRVPSNVDIAAQAAGSVIGLMLWVAAGSHATAWVGAALNAAGRDRPARLLAGYTAAWVFVNLAPFDLTLDIGELAARLRSGAVSFGAFMGDDVALPRRLWDVFAETAAAVPIGAFALTARGSRRLRTGPQAWILGTAIVGFVELAQVFVVSHTASISDVVFGSLGAALGAVAGVRILSAPHPEPRFLEASVSWPAVGFVGLWCVVLAAYHWLPFNFVLDEAAVRAKLAAISFVPLAAYGAGSYLNALNDVLTKIALSIPLGIGAAFVFRVPTLVPVSLICLLGAGVLFAVIEGGQFALPARFPDTTDVYVGIAGTLLGLSIGRWLRPLGSSPGIKKSPPRMPVSD
jgi:VanZ family protein